jgi:hypothetical protein
VTGRATRVGGQVRCRLPRVVRFAGRTHGVYAKSRDKTIDVPSVHHIARNAESLNLHGVKWARPTRDKVRFTGYRPAKRRGNLLGQLESVRMEDRERSCWQSRPKPAYRSGACQQIWELGEHGIATFLSVPVLSMAGSRRPKIAICGSVATHRGPRRLAIILPVPSDPVHLIVVVPRSVRLHVPAHVEMCRTSTVDRISIDPRLQVRMDGLKRDGLLTCVNPARRWSRTIRLSFAAAHPQRRRGNDARIRDGLDGLLPTASRTTPDRRRSRRDRNRRARASPVGFIPTMWSEGNRSRSVRN